MSHPVRVNLDHIQLNASAAGKIWLALVSCVYRAPKIELRTMK